MAKVITRAEERLINDLVASYLADQKLVMLFTDSVLQALTASEELSKLIYSIKSRLKDPEHLRDKLFRKLRRYKEEGKKFDIDKENLFMRVNDLGGIRLLHLHTRQIEEIDTVIKKIFEEMSFELLEGPSARTWDDEYRSFFSAIGIETQASPTMYTSVHYVVGSNRQRLFTCEIQVRTLMEEVWGEVDHSINYPHKIDSVPCREQILALARSTSSATRLVDAIFATVADHKSREHVAPSSKLRRAAEPPKRKPPDKIKLGAKRSTRPARA